MAGPCFQHLPRNIDVYRDIILIVAVRMHWHLHQSFNINIALLFVQLNPW